MRMLDDSSEISYSAFISHSSSDRKKAEEICDSLEARGFRCWMAPRDVRPGQEYGAEIIRGIEASRCLVLVLSQAANESTFVQREVERAVSKEMPVFPIRIEEVLPSRGLELFVSTTHWIDAWPGPMSQHMDALEQELGAGTSDKKHRGNRSGRRRRLWAGNLFRSTVGLMLIGGVVAGVNHYTTDKTSKVPPSPPVMVVPGGNDEDYLDKRIRGTGIDPASITAKDIAISPVMDSFGKNIELNFQRSSEAEKLLALADNTFLAFDDGEFYRAEYGAPRKIPVSQLDQEILRKAKTIHVRYDLLNGQEIGPFSYPFVLSESIVKKMSQNIRSSLRASLIGRYMSLSVRGVEYKDLPEDIQFVRLGYARNALNRRIQIRGLNQIPNQKRFGLTLTYIPVLQGHDVFIQWESVSGLDYPIETISSDKPVNGNRRLKPKANFGPELYVYADTKRSGGRDIPNFLFMPDVWVEAARVGYSFDEDMGRDFDAEVTSVDDKWKFGKYFSFQGDSSTRQIHLEIHWADGREPSRFSYAIEEDILMDKTVKEFSRDTSQLAAIRVLAGTPGKERAMDPFFHMKAVELGLNPYRVPRKPGVFLMPVGRQMTRWKAVKTLTYRTPPAPAVRHKIEIPESVGQPINPKEKKEIFLIELPGDTQAVYYSLQFTNGETTPEHRLSIQAFQLP